MLKQARQARDKATVESLTKKLTIPDIQPGMELYVNAYLTLDAERDPLRRIPWSSIVNYATYYKLDRRQTDTLIDLIPRIDQVILSERAKESERGDAARNSRADGQGVHSRRVKIARTD